MYRTHADGGNNRGQVRGGRGWPSQPVGVDRFRLRHLLCRDGDLARWFGLPWPSLGRHVGGETFLLAGLLIVGDGDPHFTALVRAMHVTALGAAVTWVTSGWGQAIVHGSVSLALLVASGLDSELAGLDDYALGAIFI